MDRWFWADSNLLSNANVTLTVGGVSLYDGEVKTGFVDGEVRIGERFIFWLKDSKIMALSMALVVLAEEIVEGSLLSKKFFVTLHLATSPPDKLPGPSQYSQFHQMRFRFRAAQASSMIHSHVKTKLACNKLPAPISSTVPKDAVKSPANANAPVLNLRGGLFSIERDMEKRDAAASRDVADAFQDFQKLMTRAGEMVELAKTISDKVRKQSQAAGDQGKDLLTADELVEFRSDLLALGVSAVTKDDCSSESGFHAQLATEICRLLEPVIRKTGGGLMSLTDAYCRLNRARGLSLVSPDDVLAAAKAMEKLNLPLRLHQFPTGVRCLRLAEVESRKLCQDTASVVDKQSSGSSIDSFSILLSLPIAVARERLLAAESEGYLCRDETAAGLFFYRNKFLEESISAF